MPPASTKGTEDEKRFLLDQIAETPEAKRWFDRVQGAVWVKSETREPHADFPIVPSDWKIIVVNGGKLVNLVGPLRKGGNGS